MMNIVALAVLLSSLGSAIVFIPEPVMTRLRGDGEALISSTKAMDSVKYSNDKIYQTNLAARHAHDATENILRVARDDSNDAAAHVKDEFFSAEEDQHDAVTSVKRLNDEISEVVGNAGGSVVENGQLGVDKSKGAVIDAPENTEWPKHVGRDPTEKNFDPARDFAGGYYDEAGRHYVSARDYYNLLSDYYRTRRGGRRQFRSDPHRFYDAPEDETEDREDFMKDRMWNAHRSNRGRAGDYYDDTRGSYGGYIAAQHREDPRDHTDYRGALHQRTGDEGRREDDNEGAKLIPGDYLGALIESMGWRRVGTLPPGQPFVSSPKEVVIGNVKYVWQGKGLPPLDQIDELHDTVLSHPTKAAAGAAHTPEERSDHLKDHAKERNDNTRDSRSVRPEDDDPSVKEDPDLILTQGARDLKERLRSAGAAYDAQRSKTGECADVEREELASLAPRLGEGTVATDRVGVLLLAATRALHLFTFAATYGSAVWVTGVWRMLLSKLIPRHQFGSLEWRVIPVHVRMLAAGHTLILVLQSMWHPWGSADSSQRAQLLIFVAMIAAALLHASILEPRISTVLSKRLAVEKEEGRGSESDSIASVNGMKSTGIEIRKLDQEFLKLQDYSSMLHLSALVGSTCHLWYLANRLSV